MGILGMKWIKKEKETKPKDLDSQLENIQSNLDELNKRFLANLERGKI